MNTRKLTAKILICLLLAATTTFSSCKNKTTVIAESYEAETRQQLENLLAQTTITPESRYAIINRIASKLLADRKYNDLILYLSNYVEHNPNDKYNAYWLLMTAYAYIQTDAEPVAEYYFDRIIKNYPDLMVKGQSLHFICLQHLIQISTNPDNRIKYFNQLINKFPSNISITEMYMRLAREYETIGEWDQAMKTYRLFLDQPDSSSIQIAGIPDAYNYTKTLIDFNNSPKNWTFKTLEELENAVKTAITRYQPGKLDTYRSKVNFFAVSWKQDENAAAGQVGFSMKNFMHGNKIRFNKELTPGPTPTEAYLRTTGWTKTVPTWYFYFREVNFPADPEIHGTWEWAGIYIGDML